MPRTYDRQVVRWDRAFLNRLVDEGQATLFTESGIYVVKRPEGGSVAVRPEQIVDDEPTTEIPVPDLCPELDASAVEEVLVDDNLAEATLADAEARQAREDDRLVPNTVAQDAQALFEADHARLMKPVIQHHAFSAAADDLIARFTK